MAMKIVTGPKSLMIVRSFWFRYLLLSKVATESVDQNVVSAMARDTKGIVKFDGSTSAKCLFNVATAS